MKDAVIARVVALKTTPLPELKVLWQQLFGKEPPNYKRSFMEDRLAYRIQELAYGGLNPTTVQRLEEFAEQIDQNLRVPGRKRSRENRPVAGTRLRREFHGVTYEVTVFHDHYLFNGSRYKSLSAVAKVITKTNWNGWNFFGLRQRKAST